MADRGSELERSSAHAPLTPTAPTLLEPRRGFSALTTRYGLAAGVAHVVALACQGLECKEIASALDLSESTIKKKLSLASRRLNARGRGQLCALSGMLASGMELEEAQALLRQNPGTAGR